MTPTINAQCAYCHEGLTVRGDGTYPYLTRNGNTKLIFCNHQHRVAWADNHCEHCDVSGFDTALPVIASINNKKYQFCSEEHYATYAAQHPALPD